MVLIWIIYQERLENIKGSSFKNLPNVHNWCTFAQQQIVKFSLLHSSQLFSCAEMLHGSISIDVSRTPEVKFLRSFSEMPS